jgi:hypothetical protein
MSSFVVVGCCSVVVEPFYKIVYPTLEREGRDERVLAI